MKFVESINKALDELLSKNEEIVLYGEDLIDPYGGAFKVTKGLSSKYPERVLPTPISEAAIIGMAGGMSIGGINPIVEIMFGDFITLGMDQFLNHLVKYKWMYNDKINIATTIRTTMGGRRGYGPTHSQSLEPLLASIPNLKIYSPSLLHDPGELLKNIVMNEDGIKVFCEYKLNYPKEIKTELKVPDGLSLRYSENYPRTAYLSNNEFDDPELLIISHGGNAIIIEELMIHLLMEYELGIQANFPARIKPLNYDDLFEGLKRCSTVLIIEESTKDFGWGSEIVATMVEYDLIDGKQILRIGADETPIPSSILLEKKMLPSKDKIIEYLKSSGVI